jgi:hypothetical protein
MYVNTTFFLRLAPTISRRPFVPNPKETISAALTKTATAANTYKKHENRSYNSSP